MTNDETQRNPIIARTPLSAYPGWTVREYADGMFDAESGIALTQGRETFGEVIADVRAQMAEGR